MPRKATAKKIAIKDQIVNMPAHLRDVAPTGNENVTSDDLTIPRLALLQDMSPEVKKTNPKYIEGAEAGLIFNTLTKELFSEVKLIPVYYAKDFTIFVKRDKGGGYKGNYPTKAEAEEFVASQSNGRDLDIVETANHYCIMINDGDEVVGQVLFPMSSTKLGFSRSWNSIIAQKHAVRFACAWTVTSVPQSNAKGDFFNLTISAPGDWLSPDLYIEAEKTYNTLAASIGKS